MKKYHKIQSVFRREPKNKNAYVIEGQFSKPEFEYLADTQWEFTEKVDGTNIRIIYEKGNLTKELLVEAKGRQEKSEIVPGLLKKLEETFFTDEIKHIVNKTFYKAEKEQKSLGGFGKELCLYGEGYGNNIQKTGKLYSSDYNFVLFDVKIGDTWLQRSSVERVAKLFGIGVVPIIGDGTLWDMVDVCKRGFNSVWGDFPAEGIVARPKVEMLTRHGKRVITKLKCKDFPKA